MMKAGACIHSRNVRVTSLLAAVIMALPSTLTFADGKYVKFGDLQGEALAKRYLGWSEIESYTNVFKAADKQSPCKAILEKEIDRTSPTLALRAFDGRFFPEVRVELTSTGYQGVIVPYLNVEMRQVVINKLTTIEPDEESGGRLLERIVLVPEELDLVYYRYNYQTGEPEGTEEASFDCVNGTLR